MFAEIAATGFAIIIYGASALIVSCGVIVLFKVGRYLLKGDD